MRHMSRTHRVNLDGLCDTAQGDERSNIKHATTKRQCACIFAKASSDSRTWSSALALIPLIDVDTTQNTVRLGYGWYHHHEFEK